MVSGKLAQTAIYALLLCLLAPQGRADLTAASIPLLPGVSLLGLISNMEALANAKYSADAMRKASQQFSPWIDSIQAEDCNSASSGLNLKNIVDSIDKLETKEADQKRIELVKTALGAAGIYAKNRTPIAGVLRNIELEKRSNADWCAAFAIAMVHVVDDNSDDGLSSNFALSGSKDSDNWDALSYASAEKLLQLADPNVPLKRRTFGRNPPKKFHDSFLGPNVPPVPGCMAVYKDIGEHPGGKGHIAIVVQAYPDGTMDTVEGNSSLDPNSTERGIFVHDRNGPSPRTWGIDPTTQKSRIINADTPDPEQYMGCVLPWPEKIRQADGAVCAVARSDESKKSLPSEYIQDLQKTGSLPAGTANSSDQ